MKRIYFLVLSLVATTTILFASDPIQVHIEDPMTWTTDELIPYIGQTVQFDVPFYITSNYYYQSGSYNVSPRRVFQVTNQVLPLHKDSESDLAYNTLATLNTKAEVRLSGYSSYQRMGERIINLTARVDDVSSLTLVGSPKFEGYNTRSYVQQHLPSVDMSDMLGEHSLLVCGMNLEYYLVDNLGTGYGPDDATESRHQHTKIMSALSKIKADIYGLVEIEQGQSALRKLAESLSAMTGYNYTFINDGGSASGSYTKSGYVYNADKVEPAGRLISIDDGVKYRKKMQLFKEKSSGETFIYSINHFKAKSGTGVGSNADQGDGQGIYNATRVQEANALLAEYRKQKSQDSDILIMGDLNAYAKEDPITTLLDAGMVDLHRYFHQDSSYSYVFRGQAGYLDHAIASPQMLSQVTGMSVWHINSDEHDRFTYDNNYEATPFRCSDHDPVLVGLKLMSKSEMITQNDYVHCDVTMSSTPGFPTINHAYEGYYRVYDISGHILVEGDITNEYYTIPYQLSQGFYLINVYVENGIKQFKILVQ